MYCSVCSLFLTLHLSFCFLSETSSSVMVYMDSMTSTMRTTTRPTTVTLTTTTSRTTTARMPATVTGVAVWPHTRSTTASRVQTPADASDPEDDDGEPPSSKLPNIRVEYCNPLVMMDVSWPKTRQGTVVKMPCPAGTIGMLLCFNTRCLFSVKSCLLII